MKLSELETKDYDVRQIISSNRLLIYSSKLNIGYDVTFYRSIELEKLDNMSISRIKHVAPLEKISIHHNRLLDRAFNPNVLYIRIKKKRIVLYHCGECKIFNSSDKNKVALHSYGFNDQNEGELIESEEYNLHDGNHRTNFRAVSAMTSSFSMGFFSARLDQEDEEENE